MDIFQVYNRQLNTWIDENIELIPGWSESWVLDKTTDSASVKLKYKGLIAPNWVKGDWCRILHLEGDDVGATYNEVPIIENIVTNNVVEKTIETVQLIDRVGLKKITYSIKDEYEFDGSVAFVDHLYLLYGGNTYISGNITKENPYIYEPQVEYYSQLDTLVREEGIAFNPQNINVYKEKVYIPKNHEQYIIKDISYIYDKINNEIDIQLALQEPIEMANGINCETMSFTNQINKIVDGTTYEHEALNHLSVLEKILKVTPANNDDYVNQTRQQRKSWFNRIKIADRTLLMNLPFNDETINESTIYEILLNKYDSSVGRTPVIYFDINPSTDLPNNTNRDEYVLCFERQDGFEKEEILFSDIDNNNKEKTESKNGENFADGLISNFDNLSPNNNIYTPAEILWLVPEVDTNERDLTSYNNAGTGDWVLKLPHKIKKINSVKRYYLMVELDGTNAITDVEHIVEDFANKVVNSAETNLIFEERQYNASEDYFKNPNCVWYKEGDNLIHLNEVFYKSYLSGQENKIWIYQVEYEPFVSGRFDLGNDYQKQINQTESQIDNKKFSSYLKDYFNSMNKSDITIVKTIDNFSEIIDIGTRIVKENKNYIVTNISIQNRGFNYDVVYQLNENHTRRNDNIEAPQEIRKNIELGVDATKERMSMLNKNIKLSLNVVGGNDNFIDRSCVFSSLFTTYNAENYPQVAYFTFKSDYPFVSSGTTQINLISEICRYVLNDTICFNFKFIDNAEAGKKKVLQKYTNTSLVPRVPYFYGIPKEQVPILYTDIFGEFNEFDVKLIKVNGYDLNTATAENWFDYLNNIAYPIIKNVANYPLTTEVNAEDINNPICEVENINYYKDMLDTFNYTLGFHIDTDSNIIVCDSLLKNSVLMTKNKKQVKYILTENKNMTEQDFELNKDKYVYGLSNISSSTYNNGEFILRTFTNHNVSKCVMLVDEDKNVLLIINDFDKTTNNTTFNEIRLYC